jgi:hypothetical protein
VAVARSQPHPREHRWGSYRTEFCSTYDYKAIVIAAHEKAQ